MFTQSHRILTTLTICCIILAACSPAAKGPTTTAPTLSTETYSLQILHSSDNESAFLAPDSLEPKILQYAAIVAGLRELAPGDGAHTIHVTTGDQTRTGPFYQAAAELPELGAPGLGDVAIFNAMQLTASGVGVHDFDGGLADFARTLNEASYPFIVANLDFSNVQLADDAPPIQVGVDGGSVTENAGKVVKSAYVEVAGERIGLVGRAPADFFGASADPDATVPGLDFPGGRSPETQQPLVPAIEQVLAQVDLLEAQGINKIILLDHEPDAAANPLSVRDLHGIDVIVTPASADLMAQPEPDGPFNLLREDDTAGAEYPTVHRDRDGNFVAVVNSGPRYRYVGHLLVTFDGGGHIVNIDPRSGPVATTPAAVDALAALVGRELAAPPVVEETFAALRDTELFQTLFQEQIEAAAQEDSTDQVTARQDVYRGDALVLIPGEEPVGSADTEFNREEALGIYNQRADKTTAISSDNVAQLSTLWQIPISDLVSHTPIVAEDRLYFADWGGVVYAADAQTGELLWQNAVEIPQRTYPWHGFAGTGALAQGLLIEASVEGNAFALDAETGDLVWQTRIAEQEHAGNLSDLLYYDGLVYIGLQSPSEGLDAGYEDFEPIFRGNVVALDVNTGEIVWRQYLVDPPHNGASVWSSFGLDPELGLLYFTTSNNYTGEASTTSDALIAVDAKTGAIAWTQQVLMHDVWTPVTPVGADYGFGGGAQLFEAEIDGERRKLVGAGQKSGIFFVFDRATGEEVWATFVGYGQVGGGIRGEGSVGAGRIYLWSNNSYVDGQPPQESLMTIKALDAATGRDLWLHPKAQPAGGTAGGFLSNDLFFVGSLDGTIHAYDAANGDVLWRGQVPGSVASSITVVDDMLYVGTGVPRTFGGDAKANGVLAFRLTQE